ncbi:hypothetical protein HGRIS_004435 [Hohenbuehelia grisea]|uniref:C2H2-type domain-containing protein n=1 Tax=Hohenbuehelia grisea TaxID=104357 RepID=A0ABR3JBV2_9AGAR
MDRPFYHDIPIILTDDEPANGEIIVDSNFGTAFIDYQRITLARMVPSTPTYSPYHPQSGPPFEQEYPRSAVWSDGLAQALTNVGDQDYNVIPNGSQDRPAFSSAQTSEAQECHTPSSLITGFDSFEISSPTSPSPKFAGSPLFQHSLRVDNHDGSYSSPTLPILDRSFDAYESHSSYTSFVDESPSSALFGTDGAHRSIEGSREPPFSLTVDTELYRPSYDIHSPFSDGSPRVPSLVSSSPSSYSPMPPQSNWSSLSHALDDSALSDVEISLDEAPLGPGLRRHSHTGVNTDIPSALSDGAALPRPKHVKANSTHAVTRRSARLNASTRCAPPLPPEHRGRQVDNINSNGAGPSSASPRMSSPYSRPPADSRSPFGAPHRPQPAHRSTASGQWLEVPKPHDGLLRPPSRGSHYRRHSTGDQLPYSMNSHASHLDASGPNGRTMGNIGFIPSGEELKPLSASPVDILPLSPLYETSHNEPAIGSPSGDGANDDTFLPSSPGISRKKHTQTIILGQRVTKSPKMRSTIASDATLKAAENRRKAEARFVCQICKNGFTAKHNLTRHLLAHRGEKPYRCECGQSFTNKWDRTRHQKKSKVPMCCKKSD